MWQSTGSSSEAHHVNCGEGESARAVGVTEDAERTVGLGVCLDELICTNQLIYKHAYQTDGNVCLGF